MHELWALILSLATLFVQQSPPNPPPDATPWPVAGVEHPGQAGVTPPRLRSEAKPNYTGEAMRARIQGVVVLQCIVEVDGSIGPVRIVRSLDPVYGLDDEAIRTVRRWTFLPGTRDGVPVRVEVSIEMSFVLRERGDAPVANAPLPAPLGWPDQFIDATGLSDAPVAGWVEDSAETPLISARFAHPSDWSILKSSNNGQIATLHADDAAGTRTVTISTSGPAPLSLSTPLSQSALDSFFVETAQRGFPAGLQPIRSGQVDRANGLWVWFEMAAPTIDTSNAPPAVADSLRSKYSGIHVWAFATTVNGQIVDVFCSVLHRANETDADKQEEIRRAGLEFGAVLRRVSIRLPRPVGRFAQRR